MDATEKKTVSGVTLGCKLNYAETASILQSLVERGWRIAGPQEQPDLIVVHSCAVTKQAEQKCRQKIRGLVRRHPDSRVVVTGCYAQLSPGLIADIEGVDAVLGNDEKFDSSSYMGVVAAPPPAGKPVVCVSDEGGFLTAHRACSFPSGSEGERTRAFLKLQDGCDYGCAYCTIPLARGRSRSVPPEVVLQQAQMLADSGYREIVLTGVNTGDYRSGTTGFLELLRMLEDIDVPRIRISSLEPDILTDELVALVAASRTIVPHFHLPLQNGSDRILGAMRRRYRTADYRERLLGAVDAIEDCAVGADVMVGYPGENDDDFGDTVRFIEGLPLAYLHVFSCSVRPGTVLAREVSCGERLALAPQVASGRSAILKEIGERKAAEFRLRYLGRRCRVLFEECRQAGNGTLRWSGYSRNYLPVWVDIPADERSLSGMELPVAIVGAGLQLEGRLLS